jgi:hypothetical protein
MTPSERISILYELDTISKSLSEELDKLNRVLLEKRYNFLFYKLRDDLKLELIDEIKSIYPTDDPTPDLSVYKLMEIWGMWKTIIK